MASEWTNEKWVETLKRIAESKREAYEQAQAKMLKTLGQNPIQSVEWEASEVVTAQTAYFDVWTDILNDLASGHTPQEVLDANIIRITQMVGWTLGGGSTCPFHRAVERVKGEVLFRELRDLKQMVEFHMAADQALGQN